MALVNIFQNLIKHHDNSLVTMNNTLLKNITFK